MRFFRSKKQLALSPNTGVYSKDDPEKVIFDRGTRLRVEANHWKTFCFILAFAAIYTRQPAPSVVKSYGIAADVNGKPVVTQLAAYKPEDQALRTSFKDSVTRWLTIEPVLTDTMERSRMALIINAVKAQMVGNAPATSLATGSGRTRRFRPSQPTRSLSAWNIRVFFPRFGLAINRTCDICSADGACFGRHDYGYAEVGCREGIKSETVSCAIISAKPSYL